MPTTVNPAPLDLLILIDEEDRSLVDALTRWLDDAAISSKTIDASLSNEYLGSMDTALQHGSSIALAIGPSGATRIIRTAAKDVFTTAGQRFAILLPGAPDGAAKRLGVAESDLVDLREGMDEGRLDALAKRVASARGPARGSRRSRSVAPRGVDPEPSPGVLPSWEQLDESARQAVSAAHAARTSSPPSELHMEHLLDGLYRQDPGPFRQAAAVAGLGDAEFRAIIEDGAQGLITRDAELHVVPLDHLPRLSTHASRAFLLARGLATAGGAGLIESRHLAAGALNVLDCQLISNLRAAGLQPDQALAWDAPLTPKASAQTDQPTLDDLLGYRDLVDSLAALITARETTFPLTIAISAPWGGGKSSVMRMLRRHLGPPATKGESHATPRLHDRWVLVDFPAWRYDTGQQLWAAMAKVTFDAAKVGLGWMDRLRLRWAVERPRIPALSTLARVTFAGIGGVLGYILGVLVGALAAPQIEGTTAGVVGGIGGAAAVGRAFWESASDPFKRAVQAIAAQPGIAAGDGFTPDEERRIRALMKKLLTERAGVAIFIDDLDRCSPTNLVRVIEVVNQIFVASADAAAPEAAEDPGLRAGPPEPGVRRLLFVMGMDRNLVARGIEAEYEKLLAHLVKDGRRDGADFGLAFLDKIIQLWVTLPTPSQAGLDRLLQEAAGIRPAPDPHRDAQIATITRAMETRIAGISAAQRPELHAALNRIVAEAPVDQRPAARLARAAIRSSLPPPSVADDPRLWDALKIGADCLEPNPRQRKRFNNAFRLQFYLAQDLSLRREQYAALAKLVAIRLRWPRLAHDLDEHPDLLPTLERRANGRARVTDIDWRTAAAQRRRTPEWFDESRFSDLAALCRILKVGRPEAAISRVARADIPRVA